MGGTIYVILGSHRSGTSAMARALSLAGFGDLPHDLLPPHPVDNPTGCWESRAVVAFDDDALARAGGTWDRPPIPSAAATREQVARAAEVLTNQFHGPGPLILKDPRLSLLVPLWQEILTGRGLRPVYVIMLRRPSEVAASLKARDGFEMSRGLSLWASYTMAAERATRGSARVFVTFDDLLRSWQGALTRVAEAAGRPPLLDEAGERKVGQFLSHGLKRHSVGEAEADTMAGAREKGIYDLLVATGARTPEERLQLDGLYGAIADGMTALVPEVAVPRIEGPRWLLVTGAPRSGTSLLRAMLTEHPQVGLLQEYGLTKLLRRIDAIVAQPAPAEEDWDSPGDPDDEAFNAAMAVYRDRPGRAAITRGGGDPKPEHFHAVAAGLFAGMFPGKDLRYVGDKMPVTAEWEDVPLLFSRFPELRVVAVIRNPADVVRSSLVRREATRRGRDAWPIRTVQEAATQWLAAWRTLISVKERYGGAVLVVKYEDLSSDLRAASGRLFEWLALPPHEIATAIAALPPDLALHTAAEQALVRHLFSPVLQAWPDADAEVLMARFATFRMPYAMGDTVHLGHEDAGAYLASGFSFREEWGCWTDGSRAVLSIPHGQTKGTLFVEIRVAQSVRSGEDGNDVIVRSGWGEPRLFALPAGRSRIAFVAQAEEAEEAGTLAVELLIMRPKGPDESPPDCRALGILVESFRVVCLPVAAVDAGGP